MNYVVIFKAKIKHLDQQYTETAQRLRQKAFTEYHCQKFESFTEQNDEIALSYWNSLEDIHAWHLDAEHQIAQQLGQSVWYQHFSAEICEIKRAYSS